MSSIESLNLRRENIILAHKEGLLNSFEAWRLYREINDEIDNILNKSEE